jgi:hypothetical protein
MACRITCETQETLKAFSGMIDVNSRPIYLRELRKQNMESSTHARATEGIDPPSPTKEQFKIMMMLAARDKEIAARDKELEQLQREALEDEEDILSDSSME